MVMRLWGGCTPGGVWPWVRDLVLGLGQEGSSGVSARPHPWKRDRMDEGATNHAKKSTWYLSTACAEVG